MPPTCLLCPCDLPNSVDEPTPPTPDVGGAAAWSVRLLGPELIEYRRGPDSCFVNVGYEPSLRARAIYASESQSAFFPELRERLQHALPQLPGRFCLL
jgi:hypothetical protein